MFKIDHIGIAVNSLDTAVPVFKAMLGENPAGRETVPSEEVDVVFFGLAEGRIELLEPSGPTSPLARFLARRGPGLHHVCLQVPDLSEALLRLEESGVEAIPPGVRPGSGGRPVAFLHPRDCAGVLLELIEVPG
ncbi:MAG: methylmalonyl-CoA epimerase [Candidatus Palauibacterales bacterium]|nr:methylmalonyl-CoA epimerase [Candidatus Palauibacterales bacterium]MDP2482873.1 methylmalonyl-CoA epimerase [Candidatus Palauibacterales bacterium]